MSTNKITIGQIKAMVDASLKHGAIIENLKQQRDYYNCDTTDSILKRTEILKKLETHLMRIMKEKDLEIDPEILVAEINKNLPVGQRARIFGVGKNTNVLVIILSQENGILKEYLVAPFSSVGNKKSINLLKTIPSSINRNYCAIFNDYPEIVSAFYSALSETIKNSKQVDEQRLIEQYLKVNEQCKDATIIGILISEIIKVKKINNKIQTLTTPEIRVDNKVQTKATNENIANN